MREKWPDELPASVPGYQRRHRRDWYDITNRLAKIQAEYVAQKEYAPRHLIIRALMLIWPKFLSHDAFYGRHKIGEAVKADREKWEVMLFQFFHMAGKNAPAVPGFMDIPSLEIRPRSKREVLKSTLKLSQDQKKISENEIIGHAVVNAYKSTRKLEAAITQVVELSEIDSIATGGYENVRKRYYDYRSHAFKRGFADSRAYLAEVEGKSWPNDHIWLEDFPESN